MFLCSNLGQLSQSSSASLQGINLLVQFIADIEDGMLLPWGIASACSHVSLSFQHVFRNSGNKTMYVLASKMVILS